MDKLEEMIEQKRIDKKFDNYCILWVINFEKKLPINNSEIIKADIYK